MAEPYRPVPSGAALTWVGIVVSWGAAAAALIGRGPVLGLAVALGAALGTYLFAWRVAQEAQVGADGEVVWRSLLGGGRLPLGSVRRVRAARWQRTFLYLEVDGGRGPVVPGGRGIAAFVDSLRSARPDLEVDLGAWVARLVEVDRSRSR